MNPVFFLRRKLKGIDQDQYNKNRDNTKTNRAYMKTEHFETGPNLKP